MAENKKWLHFGEVLLILSKRLQDSKVYTEKSLKSCYDYCSKFSTISNDSSIRNIRKAYESYKDYISEADFTQIVNLSPTSIDEARTLILGLDKISDSMLESLLREIEIYRMHTD